MTIENAEGEQETIDSTPEHPFYVEGTGWVEASSLHAGMTIWFANGTKGTVEDISNEGLEEPVTVYNFEVADFHTYFVGESSVLVHNYCGVEGDTAPAVDNDSEPVKRMNVGDSGHHVPAVRKSEGREFEVSRSDKSHPTLFFTGDDPGHDHWTLHNAERDYVGPRQGDFDGTNDELFDAYRNAYKGLDDIKVDVKSPDGTYNLGTNVTPYEAVNLIQNWLKEEGKY